MYLEKINQPNDIKNIPADAYDELAEEIRSFLVDKVSQTGGHLASNLGCVELTMALHLLLNFPEDKLIWDVGHQAYTHKILTGRKDGFDNLRQYKGLSGFPKRGESDCDVFDSGHSSNSISAGLGMVRARDLKDEKYTVCTVIGDGALTGGLAFEALNNAAKLETNMIIVLNDNNMSISESVGGISTYLNEIRSTDTYLNIRDTVYNTIREIPKYGDPLVSGIRKAKSTVKQLVIPGMMFENIGITYLGPVDGHNVKAVLSTLKQAMRIRKACIVHVKTKKGMGYLPALKHPARFHGLNPFDIETGKSKNPKLKPHYSDVFGTAVTRLAREHEDIVCITAAMEDGVGLQRFSKEFPKRFFDVGIAEGHAVSFAAGLALGGLRPVVAIYSTFLQRAFDEIVHDVCMQNLPVIFAIDRAGIVGADGETHQGILDIAYLSQIPGMTIMAPKNKWELKSMLSFAYNLKAPVAVRYPRGDAYEGFRGVNADICLGKAELLHEGRDVALVAAGSMVRIAQQVAELLNSEGIDPTIINARFIKPVDTDMLMYAADNHRLVVTLEEGVKRGGFGECAVSALEGRPLNAEFLNISLPDSFIEQGSVDELFRLTGIDAASISEKILKRRWS